MRGGFPSNYRPAVELHAERAQRAEHVNSNRWLLRPSTLLSLTTKRPQQRYSGLYVPLWGAITVLKVNPARRLYERLGFAIVGETETHYLMRWRPADAAEPGHAADAQEAARG